VPRPAASPDPDSVGTGKTIDCGKSRGNAIIWQTGTKFSRVLKLWKFVINHRCRQLGIIERAQLFNITERGLFTVRQRTVTAESPTQWLLRSFVPASAWNQYMSTSHSRQECWNLLNQCLVSTHSRPSPLMTVSASRLLNLTLYRSWMLGAIIANTKRRKSSAARNFTPSIRSTFVLQFATMNLSWVADELRLRVALPNKSLQRAAWRHLSRFLQDRLLWPATSAPAAWRR
jgi:hypothetical protein